MFILYEPGIDPYAWNMTQNILYYGFMRISYTISVMMILFVMIFGHFNIAKRSLTNGIFRALGKLSFQSALIYPIVIMYYYGSVQYGIYLTFVGVQYIATGNMVCIVLAGFVLYMLVEYPFRALLQNIVLKKLSHDDILREKWLAEKQLAPLTLSKKLDN
jgi:peptidoglycan/LPS O-acetylase OafA/YrhL